MIPDTIPAELLDKAFYVLHDIGQMVIRMEMSFPHHLETSRLAQALQLTMDAEPILGCRFDDSAEFGCWRRLPQDARPGLVVAKDTQEYKQLMSQDIDIQNGPAIKAHLVAVGEGDLLHIRLAHEVADAGAVKSVVQLLSTIYSRLATDPTYTPAPNLTKERNIEQIVRNLPWTARFPILGALIKEGLAQSSKRQAQTLTLAATQTQHPEFVVQSFSAQQVAALRTIGRRTGATLNDMFITACLHALAHNTQWDGQKTLSLNITADLRRYLRDDQEPGICNLSGIETLSLGRRLEERFEQTLARVSSITRARKQGWIGLNIYGSPMRKMLTNMPIEKYRKMFSKQYETMKRKGKLCPTMTNMGALPTFQFDGPPQACHLLAPPMFAPAFSLGLSGYNDTLTLSAAAFEPDKTLVQQFLHNIATNLESASKSNQR